MALSIGDPNATSGMAKAIYDNVNAQLAADVPPEVLPDVQVAWKKLSYAVAAGVTDYLKRDPASEPEFAETISTATQEPTFWPWLQQFVAVFTSWAPTATDSVALKNAVSTYVNGHAVPTEMKGSVR